MSRGLLLLILALAMQGCWYHRNQAAPPSTVLNPRHFPVPEKAAPYTEPIIEPPGFTVEVEEAIEIAFPEALDLDAPPPRRRRTDVLGQKKPAAPKVQPVPAPATVPRLGEILSPEIRANYERDFIAHVARAQDIINQAAGRNLDSNQEQTVERIRTFLAQAADLRDRGDLSNGVEIARRASLLADDLSRTFR